MLLNDRAPTATILGQRFVGDRVPAELGLAVDLRMAPVIQAQRIDNPASQFPGSAAAIEAYCRSLYDCGLNWFKPRRQPGRE